MQGLAAAAIEDAVAVESPLGGRTLTQLGGIGAADGPRDRCSTGSRRLAIASPLVVVTSLSMSARGRRHPRPTCRCRVGPHDQGGQVTAGAALTRSRFTARTASRQTSCRSLSRRGMRGRDTTVHTRPAQNFTRRQRSSSPLTARFVRSDSHRSRSSRRRSDP